LQTCITAMVGSKFVWYSYRTIGTVTDNVPLNTIVQLNKAT